MSKTSEKKLCEYEKKIIELNEFKVKRLEEERKEKERVENWGQEKKTRNNNNNTSNKSIFEAAVKEKDMDKNNVEIVNDCIVSIEYGSGSYSSSLANETDLSCAYSKSFALYPVPPISADTAKDEYKGIELEGKKGRVHRATAATDDV